MDEFREIWFQNATDPPAFSQPPMLGIENGETEAEETAVIGESTDTRGVTEAEAQSAFLEEMVADRALEEEINRHLGNEEFQQALAEVNGIPQCGLSHLELGQTHSGNSHADDANLSELDDDDEVTGAIIDDDSEFFLLRAQVWMDSNKDYLKEQRGSDPCIGCMLM